VSNNDSVSPRLMSLPLKVSLENISKFSPKPMVSPRKSKKTPVRVVILIGGPTKGTRFRPLTFELPKPLFPIGGKPMIAHQIEAAMKISESEDFFVQNINLIGFFKLEIFKPFLDNWFKTFDYKITYLEEPIENLGTGGGLLYFEKTILANASPDCKLIVMNGDICSSFPLIQLLNSHESNVNRNALCTLMTTKVPPEVAHNYGCLVVGDLGNVIHYAEKPQSFVNNIVNTGVYVFESSLISKIAKQKAAAVATTVVLGDNNNGNTNSRTSIEMDIVQSLVEKGSLFSYPINDNGNTGGKDFWYQIKTASNALHCSHAYLKFHLANKQQSSSNNGNGSNTSPSSSGVITPRSSHSALLAQHKFQVIGEIDCHPTAEIHPSAKIGPNVCIGENVKVGKGVRISHAIILDNSHIHDFSFITFSIVGWRTDIGKWSRVEGHNPSGNCFHNENPSERDNKVTVLGHDVIIGPEIMISDSTVLPNKEISVNVHNRIIL